MPRPVSRRSFLSTSAAATAVILAAPAVATARKTDSPLIVGEGDHRFEVVHNFPQLPEKFTWQTTHNVAVDRAGNLYVIHEGRKELKDHPSIFVFDSQGQYVRSFGAQFQGGGHGIEIRQEGSEEFLYVCAYQHLKTFAKLTLQGEVVWQQYAPMESGVYAEGENIPDEKKTDPNKDKRENIWGSNRFLPTNFAFLDDGGFLLIDGYGASVVHRYDKDAKWQSCFGGVGDSDDKFRTPQRVDRQASRARAEHRGLRPRPSCGQVFHDGRQVHRDPQRVRVARECRDLEEPAGGPRTARPRDAAE